jgi:pimeloyl-ACP methyl ester carboxylesterase
MTWPEPLTFTTIQQDGGTLSYAVAGAGAELVVLIHPAFGDHSCFTPQLDALAAHYRVAAIDLPGHGSAQRPDTTTRIVDTAGLVPALLAQEGYERAHLVGVSLGALVAQDIATHFPPAVSSLTVVGGYPIFGTSPALQRTQTVELLRLLPLLLFSLDRFRRAVAREATLTPQARELFLRSAQGFTRRSLRAFAGNDALLRASFQPLAAPLQIVVGEQERPLLRSVAEEWQRREPGSVLEVIPGAGHCANMDNPGVFNERLLAFLEHHRPFPGQLRGHVPVPATVG